MADANRRRPAKEGASSVAPRQSLRLSARPLGSAHRPPRPRGNSARQQFGRKRDPPLGRRKEKLAVYRPPRRRAALRHHLLDRRLLPAPQKGPPRLSARYPHQTADPDQPLR